MWQRFAYEKVGTINQCKRFVTPTQNTVLYWEVEMKNIYQVILAASELKEVLVPSVAAKENDQKNGHDLP